MSRIGKEPSQIVQKKLAKHQNVKYNRIKVKWSRNWSKMAELFFDSSQGMRVSEMSNIADLIEEYILRQLAQQQDGKVELRRTDIADQISCAPSQISYVLSTRFTHDKGFVVESRRGLGGYIRIVQVPLKNLVYEDMLGKIHEDTTFGEVQGMVRYLMQREMITNREAALAMQVVTGVFQSKSMAIEERIRMIKSLFLTMKNFSPT